MAFVASAMFWGSGYAADNSIYIDQSGDNSTITMTQDGSGNKINGILLNGSAGATIDPAKLIGNNQTVLIEQTGATNTLALGVNSTVVGGVGVNLTYKVDAGGNVGYININNNGIGTASNNAVSIIQSGGSATTTLNMTGTGNQLTVGQSGGANNKFIGTINADSTIASISQTLGGGNETTLNMTGNKGQVTVTTQGATNITNITQSAFGSAGAQAIVNINGSGNTTDITQTDGFDHYASVTVTGSSNNIDVIQNGGSNPGHSATLLVNGSSNNIALTQQGSVSNLANIKVTGSSNNYTLLQKN